MGLLEDLRERMFSHPEGWLGRFGGMLMARSNRDLAAFAIDLLHVQPGQHVLEIGFGPGVAIELLTEAAPGLRVTGIDPSNAMLEMTKARCKEAVDAGHVTLHQAGVEASSFDDGTFDRALAINATQTWPDRDQALAEIHRSLRDGGRVVLAFGRHTRHGAQGLTDALTRAGFKRARTQRSEHGLCIVADT